MGVYVYEKFPWAILARCETGMSILGPGNLVLALSSWAWPTWRNPQQDCDEWSSSIRWRLNLTQDYIFGQRSQGTKAGIFFFKGI